MDWSVKPVVGEVDEHEPVVPVGSGQAGQLAQRTFGAGANAVLGEREAEQRRGFVVLLGVVGIVVDPAQRGAQHDE